MKILILTMTCGECHNTMAQAIAAAISAPDECKICDIYGENERERRKDEKWYLLCLKWFSHIYERFWNHYRRRDPMRRYCGTADVGIKRGWKEVEQELVAYSPDVVICTHSAASNIVCRLKIHNRFQGKVYAVMHDFVNCPYWEGSVLCDAVFTPHELVNECLIGRGFRSEQLIPTGFPLRQEFETSLSKEKLREEFGVPQDAFVVLALNGGAGIGNMKGLVKALMRADLKDKTFYVSVVCGHNEKAKRKLEKFCAKRGWKNIRIHGFVQDVPRYMKAADLYFCRGGMGSFCEAMASGVNVVVREHPMAQERCNRNILRARGLCEGLKHVSDATALTERFATDPQFGEDMRSRVAAFFIPNGVKNILDYIHAHA